MSSEPPSDPAAAEFLRRMDRHLPRTFMRVMRRLPSDPRCRLCGAPYGGLGGRVMRRFGYGPSRKNPGLCNTCFEMAPMGGAEMEIGVLFADVRGFTAMSEDMPPDQVAGLLDPFYAAATRILSRSAIIDKLVGDEVMALYLPRLLSKSPEDDMVRDAIALLEATPDLRIGIGLDFGRAYVGNVGAGEVKDFTALGDVVNTASRLQSAAAAGQVVISERLFGRLRGERPRARSATIEVKGKRAPESVRVIELAG
jgi:adenylate cyclase